MSEITVPQPVLDWLFKVLQPAYLDPRNTFHDVVQVLVSYQLRPRTRVFTFPDGSSELLLSLYGVLSEVPINLWIPREYPASAPYVYLDSGLLQKNQSIKVNQYLDSTGRFYLPMLASWGGKPGSLVPLLQQLVSIWDTYYPIQVTEDTRSESDSRSTYSRPAFPIIPPKPKKELGSNAAPIPPRPPKSSPYSINEVSVVPPEIPARPTPVPLRDSDSVPVKIESLGLSERPYNAEAIVHDTVGHSQSPAANDEVLRKKTSFTFQLPPDLIDNTEIDVESKSVQNQMLLSLKSFISQAAAEDRSQVKKFVNSNSYRMQSVIRKYSSHLAYESNLMNDLRKSICENTDILNQEVVEINKELDKANALDSRIDPATIAVPETPAFVQLYHLVAKDHSLTDAISVVSQLFHKEKISLNIMLRKIRELSVEQFKTRFLMSKIVELLD